MLLFRLIKPLKNLFFSDISDNVPAFARTFREAVQGWAGSGQRRVRDRVCRGQEQRRTQSGHQTRGESQDKGVGIRKYFIFNEFPLKHLPHA